jgi:integrase
MANLGKKNGTYVARFRFQGKEFKRSLKTTDRKAAEAAMHRVEDALHRLAINVITVPEGVDAGDFIVSGGTLQTPEPQPRPRVVPTLEKAIGEYSENLGHLADSNRVTVRGHLRNLKAKLAARTGTAIDLVETQDLERFLQARLKERSSTTVSKERFTVIQFFDWAVRQGYLPASPAADMTRVKAAGDLPAFKTYGEIEAIVARGGLSPREVLGLWDCLFLSPAEIADLLDTVRSRARHEVSIILHAVASYTGMRRGEVMRLRWGDVEFEQDTIVARSKKQSQQEREVSRRIDLHPELKAILLGWRQRRTSGQFVASDPGGLGPLTSRQTSTRFFQPLRGTKWCLSSRKDWFKVGFHTYRHSFASNLAAAGIDQRVIDEWMGHTTEAMRKRYRHLFPRDRRSAIESFSLLPPGV